MVSRIRQLILVWTTKKFFSYPGLAVPDPVNRLSWGVFNSCVHRLFCAPRTLVMTVVATGCTCKGRSLHLLPKSARAHEFLEAIEVLCAGVVMQRRPANPS